MCVEALKSERVDEMEVERMNWRSMDGRTEVEGKVGKQGWPWRDVTRGKQAWHVTARDMDWLETVSLFATSFVWIKAWRWCLNINGRYQEACTR